MISSLLHSLDGFGDALLPWALAMNLWCMALLLVAAALDRLLARRVDPGWRLMLYFAVLLRLALPADWASPLALAPSFTAAPAIAAHDPSSPVAAPPGATATADSQAAVPATAPDAALLTASAAAALVYLAVALGLAFCCAAGRISLHRGLRGAVELPVPGMRPGERILGMKDLGPALVGVVRPRIVVPEGVLSGGEAARDRLDLILRHERAHRGRGDHLLALALQVITILAWPILAVWIAGWRIRQLMEMACDEAAVGREASAALRQRYAQTLVELAAVATVRRGGLSALGALGQVQTALAGRMRHLLRPPDHRWNRALQPAVVLGAVLLLVGCATTGGKNIAASDAPASAGPQEAENLLITVRILATWPDHPKLQFDMKQTASGFNQPPPPRKPRPPVEERQMSPEEFEAFLAELAKLPAGAVIAAPRVLARSGQEARIASAPAEEPDAAEEDAAEESYELAITPRLQPDGSVSVELKYTARGFPTKEPASRFEDGDHIRTEETFTIQPGDTQFLLSHGLIGAPMHLLAITIERAP